MKSKVTWILIADGAHARILENDGPGKGLTAVEGMNFSQAHLQNKDINSDKSGRSFSSVGSGRSAYESAVSPVDQREAHFVVEVAEILEKCFREGKFSRLIIAADPTSLGNIRGKLSKEVTAAVLAELPKDLTNLPTAKLGSHFDELLAV